MQKEITDHRKIEAERTRLIERDEAAQDAEESTEWWEAPNE